MSSRILKQVTTRQNWPDPTCRSSPVHQMSSDLPVPISSLSSHSVRTSSEARSCSYWTCSDWLTHLFLVLQSQHINHQYVPVWSMWNTERQNCSHCAVLTHNPLLGARRSKVKVHRTHPWPLSGLRTHPWPLSGLRTHPWPLSGLRYYHH